MITPTNNSKQPDSLSTKIWESVKVGAWREVAGFIATHPLQFMVVQLQTHKALQHASVISAIKNSCTQSGLKANVHPMALFKPAWEISKKVYAEGGVLAFYRAGWANILRQFSKAAYRAPLRAGVLDQMRERCPDWSPAKQATLASVVVATVDTVPYCVWHRWMVWGMTPEDHHRTSRISFLDFFRSSKRPAGSPPLYKDFFKGLKITYVKQLISWWSYLVVAEHMRGKDSRAETLPFMHQLYIGAVSGWVNGLCVEPFDRIKSMVQQRNYTQPATFKNMAAIAKQIYKFEGVAGFYRAFWIRLFQYIVMGLFSEISNEKVDAIWKRFKSKTSSKT